ncbi:MAG: hypothetical protein M3220_01960 [Chloroflexota bacterium]|nr:hypothetical protein [Chloroflexota bacterium]
MIERDYDDLRDQFNRFQRGALIVGGVAVLLLLIGVFFDPEQFFHSYLFAYTFWFGIGIGCLAFLLIHHLAGGAWSAVLRPVLEAGANTLPLMALLFIPLLLPIGMHALYEWTHLDVVAEDPLLQYKRPWLNTPFFIGRTIFYWAVWLVVLVLLNRWGTELERTEGDPVVARSLRVMSAPGLVFFGLTTSFAAFDWLMSLEPHWFSTIYGLLITAGWALTAFAFVVAVTRWLGNREPVEGVVTPELFNDYGSLLLAAILVWTYTHVSQFLLIWSGNLPEEITWYLRRQAGGWALVAVAIVIFHFAVPFTLLIFRDIKRNARLLAGIALFVLFMRLVETFWVVAPSFYPEGFHLHWLDLVAPVAIGGLVIGVFFWQLAARPLVYVNDPKLEEPAEHGTIETAPGDAA